MPYELPPDLECEYLLRVSAWGYSDVEQVLRDALTALDARNREVTAIQEAVDAVNRGEVRDFDDFCREFCAEQEMPHE